MMIKMTVPNNGTTHDNSKSKNQSTGSFSEKEQDQITKTESRTSNNQHVQETEPATEDDDDKDNNNDSIKNKFGLGAGAEAWDNSSYSEEMKRRMVKVVLNNILISDMASVFVGTSALWDWFHKIILLKSFIYLNNHVSFLQKKVRESDTEGTMDNKNMTPDHFQVLSS